MRRHPVYRMRRHWARTAAALCASVLLARSAAAQNLTPGQPAATFTLSGTQRYYSFNAVRDRSYCAEMVTTTEIAAPVDSQLFVYRQDHSPLTSNDDAVAEPSTGMNNGGGFSRA